MTSKISRRSALLPLAALGLAPLSVPPIVPAASPPRGPVDALARRYSAAARRAAAAWAAHEAVYGGPIPFATPALLAAEDRSFRRADRLTAAREDLGRELVAAIAAQGLRAIRVDGSLYVAAAAEGGEPDEAALTVLALAEVG